MAVCSTSIWGRCFRYNRHVSKAIRYSDGKLFVEGCSIEALVKRFGSPLYIYSAGDIAGRYAALSRAFKSHAHLICYAVKANTNSGVLRLLARAGAGADIVSAGELRRALAAGIPASRIVYSGVGKTPEELEYALGKRIRTFNLESDEELTALSKIARRRRRVARIAVRVNPDVDAETHEHITTGRAQDKFGVAPPRAYKMFLRAAKDRWLQPVGIQSHIGSQILKVRPYVQALRQVLSIVDRLRAQGIELEHIDVGGGMGIRYQRERPFKPQDLARVLAPLLRGRPEMLILEPGRWLVGESGVLATRVIYRKQEAACRFIVVDAAMNDLLRPSLYAAYHEILPVRRSRGKLQKVDVVGPVCETGDFLAKGRRLPWPAQGDLLAVLQAGAYGFTMSSQYNSRPRPAEVLVQGRRAQCVRDRETLADVVRRER
jgi:diaminopimelate decarboxylase